MSLSCNKCGKDVEALPASILLVRNNGKEVAGEPLCFDCALKVQAFIKRKDTENG